MNALVLRSLTPILTFLAAVSLQAAPDTLTIVFFGDTHTHLTGGGPRDSALNPAYGGIARAAAFVAMTKTQQPNVLTLHSGDLSTGDALFARYGCVPELRILAHLGFDAVTLGNHEFDVGPAMLQNELEQAFSDNSIPVLSANLVATDTSVAGLRSRVLPYTIKDFGGFRVGIFGLTTTSTNAFSRPSPASMATNVDSIAAFCVRALRDSGCRVVVLLSHLGEVEDRNLVGIVNGIDVVIGGHDHSLTVKEPFRIHHAGGSVTRLAYPGAFYFNAGMMQLTIDDSIRESVYLTPALNQYPGEPQVQAEVNRLATEFESTAGPLYTVQVANVGRDIDEQVLNLDQEVGSKDSPLGDLLTDAIADATGADIVLVPGGLIAEKLYRGPITASDVYRAVGYGLNDSGLGFRIMMMEVPGSTILRGLDIGVANLADDETLLQISGIADTINETIVRPSYWYDPTRPPLSRILVAKTGRQPIQPGDTLTLAVPEMVVGMLEGMGLEYWNLRSSGKTDFEILLDRIVERVYLAPAADGRIKAITVGAVPHGNPGGSSISMSALPAPMRHLGVIDLNVGRRTDVVIDLLDMRGIVVQRSFAGHVDGSIRVPVDVTALPVGVYYCRVLSGQESTGTLVRVVR